MQEGQEGGCGWESVAANQSRSDGRAFTRCEVDGGDICAVYTGPVLEVDALGVIEVLLQLCRVIGLCGDGVAADAGVVDQDAQALLARLNLLHQFGDVVLACDVEPAQWDNVALNFLSICLLDLVELLSAATRDVDLCNVSPTKGHRLRRVGLIAHLCAVDGQGLRDHQTNPAATSSDQGDAALQVEQVIAVQLAMAGCGDALGCHCGCLC